MRNVMLSCLMLLAGQAAALAQDAPALGSPQVQGAFAAESAPLRFWASAEYLAWWVRSQQTPGPLVTTGNPASPTAGFSFDPSTRVLFGDRNIGYGTFSGARFALGAWIDDQSITGIELSAFYLPERSSTYSAASDANGLPVLVEPFKTQDGGPGAAHISSNGVQSGAHAGALSWSTSSRFMGAELNGVFNAWRVPADTLDLVVGLRYLNLQEDLLNRVSLAATNADFQVQGNDSFNTRNNFYGAQIGARWTGAYGPLSVSVAGLIAIGVTDETVAIDGATTITGKAATTPGTYPGFVYSQPTNIGQFRHSEFSAVPQAQLKLGYDLSRNIRLTVGYDFLLWTDVVRPGDQIDYKVNLSQVSPDLSTAGKLMLVGAAHPVPTNQRTDFWAQGVTCGLEFRW